MAKKASADNTTNPAASEKPVIPPKSDGWEDISISGPQKWHICRVGNTVCGKLLGRHFRARTEKVEAKHFFRIELLEPTAVMVKEDMDEPAIERMAEKGDIVCVDERKDLEDIAMLCDDGGVYLVRLTPTEKIQLGTRSFWRWGEKRKKMLKPPTRNPRPIEGKQENDDIPF